MISRCNNKHIMHINSSIETYSSIICTCPEAHAMLSSAARLEALLAKASNELQELRK